MSRAKAKREAQATVWYDESVRYASAPFAADIGSTTVHAGSPEALAKLLQARGLGVDDVEIRDGDEAHYTDDEKE